MFVATVQILYDMLAGGLLRGQKFLLIAVFGRQLFVKVLSGSNKMIVSRKGELAVFVLLC